MRRLVSPMLLAALVACASTPSGSPPSRADLAITNVALVDVEGGRSVPGRTVLIADGRIVEIGSVDSVPLPTGARVVDAGGGSLIPACGTCTFT